MGLSKKLNRWRRRGEQTAQQDAGKRKSSQNYTLPATAAQEKTPKEPNTQKLPPFTNVPTELEAEAKENVNISISERVWNRAFDELANDEATSRLVEDYVKIIPRATNPDGSDTAGDNLSGDMKDTVRRQMVLKRAIKAGQAKIAEAEKVTGAMGSVVKFVNKFKDVIDLAVSTNPQAALPWAGACIGLQFLLNPAEASASQRNGIAYITTRMDWYCHLTKHLLSQENIDIGTQSYEDVVTGLEERVVTLYKAILLFQMKSVCFYYKSQGVIFLRNTIMLDNWDGDLEDLKSAETAVQMDSDQYSTLFSRDALGEIVKQGQEEHKILGDFHQTLQDYISAQKSARQDEQDANCLRELYVVDPQVVAEAINGRNDKLLRAAYEWILDTLEYRKFIDWSNPESCQVLWLHGPAGTGKSRLAIGIIAELSQQSFNIAPGLAYFFFQSSQQNMSSPTSALRSLIWMLLIQQPHLFSYIRQTLRNAGGNYFNTSTVFWSLAEIFKKMLGDEHLSPVILVLDALDECDETNAGNPDTQHLISLISDTLNISHKIKWLLSSRPETKSFYYKKLINYPALGAIIDVDVQSRSGPVEAYIKHKLSELERENDYPKNVLNDISIEIRERAQNTFLWVSLVFRDIIENKVAEYDAVEHVRSSPPSLKNLYTHLMSRVESLNRSDPEYCKAVIAAVCFAYRPLSYAELHVVSGLPHNVRLVLIVPKCGSLLTVRNGIVHLPHNSTREYLNDFFASKNREGGTDRFHADIANHSIQAMSRTLKKNIYNIQPWSEFSSISVPDQDPLAGVRYLCEFWVDHLCEGKSRRFDDGAVFSFLGEHLHWLESLSLINKLPSAVASIRKLLLSSEPTSHEDMNFIAFLKDATRFITRYLSVMKDTPLQTYGLPLTLSPAECEMKVRYWKERLSYIVDVTGVRDDWDSCLLAIDVPGLVNMVVFSPDGTLFASSVVLASTSGTAFEKLRVWDTVTGVCTQRFDVPEDQWLHSIAFSPDHELISYSGTEVQFWEVATGKCRRSFEIPSSETIFAEFSPDCAAIALTCENSIELWDITTESRRWRIDDYVEIGCMAFSPDGTLLAFYSSNGRVMLSHTADGTCKQILHIPHCPLSMVFSPDCEILATVSATALFWDIASGTCKQALSDKTHEVDDPVGMKAVFLPNGKCIVMRAGSQRASFERRIDLMDVATSSSTKNIAHITGYAGLAASRENIIATSTYSLSGSLIRLWDASNTREQHHTGHHYRVLSITFSLAGQLATESQNKTVSLRNSNGKLQHTLEAPAGIVGNIVFSPDGTTLAAGSRDGKVMLWDTTTGGCMYVLNILEGDDAENAGVRKYDLSFSPTGSLRIAARLDEIIKIWDTTTGLCKHKLEAEDVSTWLSFSHDDEVLVVSSLFGDWEIWNLAKNTRIQISKGEIDDLWPSCGAISPDKQLIALGADEIVNLYAISGALLQSINTHGSVRTLSISEDGAYLKTSQGSYKMTSGALSPTPDPETFRSWIYLDGFWVMRGEEKLLRLPPDYKEKKIAIWNNRLAIGDDDGQVVVIELAES